MEDNHTPLVFLRDEPRFSRQTIIVQCIDCDVTVTEVDVVQASLVGEAWTQHMRLMEGRL